MIRKNILIKLSKWVLILLILFVTIYNLILSDYNPMFKDDEVFQNLKKELENSNKDNLNGIPELYCKIYDIKSVKQYFFLNSMRYKRCPSIDLVRILGYNLGSDIKLPFIEIIYALKIEKEFSSTDCLIVLFDHTDYCFDNLGIRKASKFYLKKNIEDLNQRDKLILIAMYNNPSLFNPLKRPQKVEARINSFEKILKNKRE